MSSTLAQPLSLPCGATLSNRIAKGAMTEGVADERNRATPAHARLYERWADGGAGMLLTGNVQVDRRYLERPGNVAIEGPQSPEAIEALKAFAAAGTRGGTHLWMQISHAGRQTPAYVSKVPVGPSAVQVKVPGGSFGRPRALTEAEVEDIISRFAHVARTAKETGFTGVQVHGAHGYLISSFLNPLANQRADKWGGSLENRARLLLEVVRAVRMAVGTEFPVAVKLNSADFQKGGFSFEECLDVVRMLNGEGIDLLEVSGGNYEQASMFGADGEAPPVSKRASTLAREAYFLDYAAAVREVGQMPLMVTGGFRSRAGMEAALGDGAADVVGIARPFVTEPDFPRPLLEGSLDGLRNFEDELRVGPGILGPTSPIKLIRNVNIFGTAFWYYGQIFRLAAGLDPDPKLGLLSNFMKIQSSEQKAGKALVR